MKRRSPPSNGWVDLSISVSGPRYFGEREIRRIVPRILRAEGLHTGSLSIALVDDLQMAALHRRHMGIAGPTDVLTFDFGSDSRAGSIDGEVVVCLDVAETTVDSRLAFEPAPDRPRPARRLALIRAELLLYLTHGILHLAGYQDRTRAGFQRMHSRENEILSQLGFEQAFGNPRLA